MWTGLPLTDDDRTFLFNHAQDMVRRGEDYKKIKTPDIEGFIETRWRRVGLGEKFGIEFRAHIETNFGENTVHYFVSYGNLRAQDGEWVNYIPSPSMFPYSLN
jgi:hypothetical protein